MAPKHRAHGERGGRQVRERAAAAVAHVSTVVVPSRPVAPVAPVAVNAVNKLVKRPMIPVVPDPAFAVYAKATPTQMHVLPRPQIMVRRQHRLDLIAGRERPKPRNLESAFKTARTTCESVLNDERIRTSQWVQKLFGPEPPEYQP